MADLDLGGVYPQDAQQGIAMAMDAPTVQVPANNAGLSLGGGLSLPQTVSAPAPPPPGTIQLPPQTITGSPPPATPMANSKDLAYNQALQQAIMAQGQQAKPSTIAQLQALGAVPEVGAGGSGASATPPGPAIVKNTFAAPAATGPSPAANVPLANPADIQGVLEAEKGQQGAQQSLAEDQAKNDESVEKLEGGEAADAKTKDIEAGIKANRAHLDAQAHYSKIQDAYDKLSRMSVDPERYAKSLDTGHKIMQTLANVFGGISAGIKGGPNQAVEEYQRRVQNDIDAQKDNIANGYKSVAGQEGLYEQFLKATGTPQEAEALALTAHQEALKHALGKVMAGTQSKEDYDKARAAWYAAAQQQHETMIKYHKYLPAGALGGGGQTSTPGTPQPQVGDIAARRASSQIDRLEQDGDLPGAGWTDRLRHLLATGGTLPLLGKVPGVGSSIESPEATRLYTAKDQLVAQLMRLRGDSRVSDDNIQQVASRYQTPEQVAQLQQTVKQLIADKDAIPPKQKGKGEGRGERSAENDEDLK
jgi:hypothetical protein